MNKKQSILILVSMLMVFAMLLGACQPQTIVETVEVEKIVEVETEAKPKPGLKAIAGKLFNQDTTVVW